MSDERKIDEELESADDVEAHHKVKQASTEPTDDDGDDVVAHHKVKQASSEASDDDGDDDVQAHMKVKS